MLILNYNLDTDVVSLLPGDPQAAEYTAPKGQRPVQVVFQRGGVNVMLTNTVVSVVIRNPADEGAGYVANTLALTQGSTAAQGFVGVINTDTAYGRTILNQTTNNASPEILQINLNAAVVLSPNNGSPSNESNPFAWVMTSSKFRTDTPPASITAVWSSPAQLQAAIAQAAAAVKTGDAPTFSGLTVSGETSIQGVLDLPTNEQITQGGNTIALSILTTDQDGILDPIAVTNGQSIRLKANGSGYEGYTPNTGDGSALTNLNPANLSGPVPLNKLPAAVAGGFHYVGAWDANANSPTLSSGVGAMGAVYRVSVAGGTTLDGISTWLVGDELAFDGTRWDKFNGAGNEVLTVNGVAPIAGAVTLPADQAANVASERTLGSGPTQAAPGNDNRFPAYVTGLRKSSGLGNTDVAAIPNTDYLTPTGPGQGLTGLAPFHPVSYAGSPGGPSGNGTTIAYSGGAAQVLLSGSSNSNRQFFISDTSGTLILSFGSDAPAGTLIATITFASAYASRPGNLQFIRVDIDENHLATAVAPHTVPALNAVLGLSVINIYAAGGGVASGSFLAYQYNVPPV